MMANNTGWEIMKYGLAIRTQILVVNAFPAVLVVRQGHFKKHASGRVDT
jgi:hypothetical protein